VNVRAYPFHAPGPVSRQISSRLSTRGSGWIGDRKQSTVWDIQSVHRTQGTSDDVITEHSTQKPVECMSRPLRNHTGDVYDPFVGSGTTIIAAEQLGRRCYAMEIDAKYCRVAIDRWQNFTGRQAEKL
jgi:DNA modification methylase